LPWAGICCPFRAQEGDAIFPPKHELKIK
jgi:hypothetical protein